jgi:hypothetical protein
MQHRTKAGWYYVGHGQLRFMDANGWTDEYRNIDNPPRAVQPEEPGPSSAVPTDLEPADGEPVDRSGRRVVAWFLAGAVTAVLAVMAGAPHALVALFETSAEVLAPAPLAQGGPADGVTAGRPPPSDATAPTSPPPSSSPPSSTPSTSSTPPTASAPPTPLVSPSPVAATFQRQRALAKAVDLVGDIKIVDQCLADEVDVNSALALLSRSYGRLAETGVPPGIDRSDYVLRLTTLQTLTIRAAEVYDDDRTQALAHYSAARSETGVLFEELNVALGSDLSLP